MKAFISPYKVKEWKINKSEFIESLEKGFSKIEIKQINNENRRFCLKWSIKINDSIYIEGMLDKTLNCVYFETNDVEWGYTFSKWVRKFMPKDEEIIIYDESYDIVEKLDENTDKNILIGWFA